MGPLRRTLAAAGYRTCSLSYPSRKRSLEALAQHVGERLAKETAPQEPLAAVVHSMGGLLLRLLAERFAWQKAVMLCTPNGGSRLAARLASHRLYRRYFGPAGGELAAIDALPVPRFPFGIIAGTRRWSPGNPTSWLSAALQTFPPQMVHDGTVAAAETQHPAMSDYAEIYASHTGILATKEARRLVLGFLATSRFPK